MSYPDTGQDKCKNLVATMSKTASMYLVLELPILSCSVLRTRNHRADQIRRGFWSHLV